MKPILPTLLLLGCLLAAAGCTGTDQATPEYSATPDEAREVFGPETPVPSYLPEGYVFENATRSSDGSVTLTYSSTAADLRITRLSSPDAPCPGPTVAGNKDWIVQGDGIEGRLVYEGDDRSPGSPWLLRWDWNDASFCMTGRLPMDEMMRVAASAVSERRAEPRDPYLVAEETARDHATAALVEFIVAGPGLTEGEAWRNATVGAGPVLFADRNGRPFVYHYPVESGGTTIGSIKIAARTVLGGPVMDYGTTPPTAFDPDDAVSWAIAATKRIYPGCSVRDARPCYASPVTGVLVRAATADGTETCLLFDPASGRMVDEWVPTEEDAATVDHLGRILDQDEAEGRVAAWHEADVRYRGTLSFAERHGINLRQPLSEEDFERYVDFFENLAVSPAPDTPIPEPDTAAWERELEEWQQRADWSIGVAYNAELPDDEVFAIIEEHLGSSPPGGLRTSPADSWLCLNATAAEFAGYRVILENHAVVRITDANEAFFMSVIENPKTVGDRTLWLFDIGQKNPSGMTSGEIIDLLLAEGVLVERIRIAYMRAYSGDRDEREQFAQGLNADARLLFVMKEYLN